MIDELQTTMTCEQTDSIYIIIIMCTRKNAFVYVYVSIQRFARKYRFILQRNVFFPSPEKRFSSRVGVGTRESRYYIIKSFFRTYFIICTPAVAVLSYTYVPTLVFAFDGENNFFFFLINSLFFFFL